ncbi:MAG: hypothetical protein M3O35_21280 [Acidobacteriota bacterium]|nr:hypothetical protein [Acidobacteriota bacterium]
MANGLAQALTTLAQSFHVQVVPATGASQTFQATLLSPALKDGVLQVGYLETTTQLVQSAISLSWLTKNVRFVDPDITHSNVLGGMPVTDLLTLNIGAVTNGATSPPGVPGVLGAINGTVQIPMDVTSTVQLNVQVDARWVIRDEQGNVVSGQDLSWSLINPDTSVAQQGTGGDISVIPGFALDVVSLVFNVLFVEALSFDAVNSIFPAPIVKRSIQASIQLRAGTASSGWVDLLPVDVTLAVIAIPTILMLFDNASYANPGVGLIMVPANSPLDGSTITTALTALNNTLTPFQNVLSVLGFIIGETAPNATIGNAVSAAQNAQLTFQKTDGISDLSTIEWDNSGWFARDAEDAISSLIMIGPPGRQAQCFNGRGFVGSSEGQMNVNVGSELLVEVPNLHSGSPQSNPTSAVSVPFAPTGWRWAHSISVFGDEFSSIQFG